MRATEVVKLVASPTSDIISRELNYIMFERG